MSGQRPLAELNDQISLAQPVDASSAIMSNQVFSSSLSDFREGTGLARGHGAISQLVPNIELGGFDQPVPDNDHSLFHAIKTLFTGRETEGEKLKGILEKQLSPEDQRELKKEQDELNRYMTESSLVAKPPETPVMDKLNRMVQNQEQQIAHQIRQNMSPADRYELDREMQQYNEARQDYFKRHMTGGGLEPMPEPGPAVKDFYQREAEAVEHLGRH